MSVKLKIAGSKSVANRALILNFLTGEKTILKNIPPCDDTKYMREGLKKLKSSEKAVKIYTENAGTSTRFLTAAAVLTGKKVSIDGSKRMRERPIRELIDALNNLGAKITSSNGYLPLKITPSKLKGGKIKLPGNISSQYLSAILMIAPFSKEPIEIEIEQELYSKPYVEMTLKMMKEFELNVENKNYKRFIIKPIKKVSVPNFYTIESDASSASYIGAYVALRANKKVLLENMNKNSIQGDIKFLSYLEKMGCKISNKEKGIQIQGPKELKSLGTIDMNKTPDLVMTFAILATQAKGKTHIKNIENLRIKECDRLQALENELKKIGAKIKTTKDSILIEGMEKVKLKKILISTYNDHRIAMSFAILDGIIKNVKLQIENPECVSKSYTTFWRDLEVLKNSNPPSSVPRNKSQNIILIGLRGSGKTKIGELLAKKLKFTLIDTDREIEKKEKMTIKEIVEKKGWKHFRKLEKDMITNLAKTHPSINKTIISTGGGAILNSTNIKNLQSLGKIIYLHRKPEDCVKYTKNTSCRPPLTEEKSPTTEMKKLYKERHPLYLKIANFTLNRTNNAEKDTNRLERAKMIE